MAGKATIKHTQLTRAGYTYQDLICIRMLIDWYHDPSRYEWMCVEGTKELGILKSLDDVIGYTQDGQYELYQVKFTTDSERDDLRISFEWLLEKKGNGKSLIEKWFNDLRKFGSDRTISILKLVTNRKPDEEFGACLKDNKVDLDSIPAAFRETLCKQLGDEASARSLFDLLTIEHSQSEIDDLENTLKDSLVPDHASLEGWLQFQKTVERWATRQNEPAPDGLIRVHHLHEILSLGSRKTISQYFEIPEGYIPPLPEFHKEILEKTAQPGCWVISGRPGMGKSTYLSYLTEQLAESKKPVIRHHYSLSSQMIGDRISYDNAARSLQSQIKTLYPSDFPHDELDPHELENWIRQAGDIANNHGEILTVIVDGLDHVYRERTDISQLQHLINRLEPLKDKVCLLFGTQPVSDEYLPVALLRAAPRERSWTEIPAMGLEAIKAWVEFQVADNSIAIAGAKDHEESEIVEISQALMNVSSGYPLHIIYSINSLKGRHERILSYDIERLPKCPDGDIHSYYESLWTALSESAREILLLIANADFAWPDETHLGYCFDDSLTFRNSFGEIQHLVEKRLSGIFPFHGSLLVYLKAKSQFRDSYVRLNEKSRDWIKRHAPEYWKWGWEWIVDANLGDITPLLEGLSRDWLIDSICRGYPLENIEHILTYAENLAYKNRIYTELVRLRLLKARLWSGPEFQIQDYGDFLDCALSCTSDHYGLLWRADNIRIISNKDVAIVAKHFQDKDERIVEQCAEEIYRRIRFYARLEDSSHHSVIDNLIDGYLDVLTSYRNVDIAKIHDFHNRLNDKESSIRKIVSYLIKNGNRHALLDISDFEMPDTVLAEYIDQLVLTAKIEGISLEDRFANSTLSKSYSGVLYQIMEGKEVSQDALPEPTLPTKREEATSIAFSSYFFYCLDTQLLNERTICDPSGLEPSSLEGYIEKVWKTFEHAAVVAAARFSAGEYLTTTEFYDLFHSLQIPNQYEFGYDSQFVAFNVKEAIAKVVIELSILCGSTDTIHDMGADEFERLTASAWWQTRIFLNLTARTKAVLLPEAISSTGLMKLYEEELTRRDDTASLANDSLELGLLARNVGLQDIALRFLHRSAANVVGYGWRKDTTLHEVFEAIEECSNANSDCVSDWLRRVAPFTNDVFTFSEREIRHIPGWYIEILSKHMPERLVDEFDFHLKEQDWSLTHTILENIIKSYPLTTKVEHAFLKCMTTHEALAAMKLRADGDETLSAIYEHQLRLLGGAPPPPRERSSTTEDDAKERPDVKDLSPDDTSNLADVIEGISYSVIEDFMKEWIDYWFGNGKGKEVLNFFESLTEGQQSSYNFQRCIHDIFKLSLRIEGKRKAYKWALLDIRLNNCWGRWSGSKADESLKSYGSIYKDDWERLLSETTKPGSARFQKDDSVIVPSRQLVMYLIAAEQFDLAYRITEVMVSSLEGDIQHLPLTDLHWYREAVAIEDAPYHLLFLHYKWPDRYSRIQSAKQIAELLSDKENPSIRNHYLGYLARQECEVGVVDYLSILSLVEGHPISPQDLLPCVMHPSLVSDEILYNLGYLEEERESISDLYSEFPESAVPDARRFMKHSNGLALRYMHVIEEIEKKHDIPLVRHMHLEWEAIHERANGYIFDPHSFCGDVFYRQDRIGCSFSWPAEVTILSAYIRTLSYAHDKHSLPLKSMLRLMEEALPLGGEVTNIAPTLGLENWPAPPELQSDDVPPDQSTLSQYLESLCNSNDIPLFANGPILRDHGGVCVDLRVFVVAFQDATAVDPRRAFDAIDHVRTEEEGVYPLAETTYPSLFGRWETDWLMRGFAAPTFTVGDLPVASVTATESELVYRGGTVVNAVWRYWVHHWYPVHLIGVGNSLGTALTATDDFLGRFKKETGGDFHMIGELTIIDRRNYMRQAEPSKLYAIRPI